MDYDKEVLNEGGFIVELSNRGEKKKHNPNFYNTEKVKMKCVSPGCNNETRSVHCVCSEHTKLKDYPLHSKDWVGRTIPPGSKRDEVLTFALPHGDIAEMLVDWIGGDSERGKQMDSFVDEVIKKIHEKIPDATTMQEIYSGKKKDEDAISPDDLVKLTKELVEKHFPKKEYEKVFVEGVKFKKIKMGKVPLRVVLANLVLALACEESNRGDARGAEKAGLKPRYANMFMPLVGYLLQRKGATKAEAKMSARG